MYLPLMSFFGGEFTTATLKQYSAGGYVDGEWVPSSTVDSTISVTFPQAMKPNELQSNEQGERISDFVKVYTAATVNPRRGNIDADLLTVQSENYKVWQVDSRPIGEYRKVILRRIDD